MYVLNDLLTSSGNYPSRAKSPECTKEVLDNGLVFLTKVNAFFSDLGLTHFPSFSSGFRPTKANAKADGAKKSNHLIGRAGDFVDPDGFLAELILKNQHLLVKHGLYLESPKFTIGWVHLQDVAPGSGRRIFIPR